MCDGVPANAYLCSLPEMDAVPSMLSPEWLLTDRPNWDMMSQLGNAV
jgi:hypothetical protein